MHLNECRADDILVRFDSFSFPPPDAQWSYVLDASLGGGVGKWLRSDGIDGPIRKFSFNPATEKGAGEWEEAARLWHFEFVLDAMIEGVDQ